MFYDPWKILELDAGTADEREIRNAFHRLAKLHHPDVGGDEERFKEISAAYAVLRDPDRREALRPKPVPTYYASATTSVGWNNTGPVAWTVHVYRTGN